MLPSNHSPTLYKKGNLLELKLTLSNEIETITDREETEGEERNSNKTRNDFEFLLFYSIGAFNICC